MLRLQRAIVSKKNCGLTYSTASLTYGFIMTSQRLCYVPARQSVAKGLRGQFTMHYVFVIVFLYMCAWDRAGKIRKIHFIENICIAFFTVCMLTIALHYLTS